MNIDDVLTAFDKSHNESPKSNNYWSYDSRDSVENFIKFYKSINKPSTTTNEQPTSEQIDNALDCLYGDNSCNHSEVINYLNKLT
jgi:hypothetical protein